MSQEDFFWEISSLLAFRTPRAFLPKKHLCNHRQTMTVRSEVFGLLFVPACLTALTLAAPRRPHQIGPRLIGQKPRAALNSLWRRTQTLSKNYARAEWWNCSTIRRFTGAAS